ncbi:MAG: hypothetical protein H6541_00060 [Lentimicrobiaceae bacterium]|nr:hypothetical protein [Lentimicrobiaceae bacterium]MCO5266444.1 hypothetical protein [Lentimicrobium sp.]
MKKELLVIVLIFIALTSYSQQGNPLPIKVDFRQGLIVFTIPPPYHTQNIRPMAVPGYVTSMRTMVMQQYSPAKDEILSELEERTSNVPGTTNNETRLAFAKDVALYIYISNNNTTKLPEKARQAIETWNTDADAYAIKTEIGLVKDYIQFGDEMTEKGEAGQP